MALTQEYIQTLFDYKDGFLYWKISRCNAIKVGDKAGHLNKEGNRQTIRLDYKLYYASRLIFLLHKGWLPKMVDHKDRDTLNDKIKNLRAATHSQNCQNKSSLKNSSSKYLGVVYAKRDNKWYAQIKRDRKSKFLGSFKTEEEAAVAYNIAATEIFGEFANLNII